MKRKALFPAASLSGAGEELCHWVMDVFSAGLKLNHHVLRWLEQAQLTELQATHDWTEALQMAADRTAHATTLDEVLSAQGQLFSVGLHQATNGRGLALASWIELQAAMAEDLQSQTADALRAMSPPSGGEALASSMPAWPVATLLDQTRAALGAVAGAWLAALQPPAGSARGEPAGSA